MPDGLVAGAADVEVSEGPSKTPLEKGQGDEARRATMPSVAGRDSKGDEVIYAVANNGFMLMPDLSGRSVRDVARACTQLGLRVEARGETSDKTESRAGTDWFSGQCLHRFTRMN